MADGLPLPTERPAGAASGARQGGRFSFHTSRPLVKTPRDVTPNGSGLPPPESLSAAADRDRTEGGARLSGAWPTGPAGPAPAFTIGGPAHRHHREDTPGWHRFPSEPGRASGGHAAGGGLCPGVCPSPPGAAPWRGAPRGGIRIWGRHRPPGRGSAAPAPSGDQHGGQRIGARKPGLVPVFTAEPRWVGAGTIRVQDVFPARREIAGVPRYRGR